jgi:hypothetical protein
MGLVTSVQQFVERLTNLNRYLLYFPGEKPKQLDQDEIIEILDQFKAPEWHEAMVNTKIDIFEMCYEVPNNHSIVDCREIAKFKQQNKALFEGAKAGPGKKSLAFLFLFE